MRRSLRRRLTCWAACVFMSAVLYGPAATAWADSLDRDVLKQGMTLNEVVQIFGQPVRMEWVNMKGQGVFFLFYDDEDCLLCLGPILDRDLLKQDDGRTVLPMGFVTEQLAGWGRKFYQQIKFPE